MMNHDGSCPIQRIKLAEKQHGWQRGKTLVPIGMRVFCCFCKKFMLVGKPKLGGTVGKSLTPGKIVFVWGERFFLLMGAYIINRRNRI